MCCANDSTELEYSGQSFWVVDWLNSGADSDP